MRKRLCSLLTVLCLAAATCSAFSLPAAAAAEEKTLLVSNTLEAGEYYGVQTAELSANDSKATVYYTTDGSVPTTDSAVYSGPIRIGDEAKSTKQALRYFAVSGGGDTASDIYTDLYTVIVGEEEIDVNLAAGKAVTGTAPDANLYHINAFGLADSATTPIADCGALTDGSLVDSYGLWRNKESESFYYTVDLGAEQTFNRVALYASAKGYTVFHDVKIETSADNAAYTQVFSKSGDYDKTVLQATSASAICAEVEFDKVSARYVRVYVDQYHTGSKGYLYSILSEIEITNSIPDVETPGYDANAALYEDDLNVIGMEAPSQGADGTVTLKATFDRPYASGEYYHVNGSPQWLISAAAQYGYNAANVSSYIKEGILDAVSTKIFVNGKPVQQYWEEEQSLAYKDMACAVHIKGITAEIRILGQVENNRPATNAIADLNQEFTVEFKAGFITPNFAMVRTDQKYTYNPTTGKWTSDRPEEPDIDDSAYADLDVLSVSGPSFTDGVNVTFKATLSEAFADMDMYDINAPSDWLVAVSPSSETINYTQEQLAQLAASGVLRAVNDCIKINGKSVQQIMDEETDRSYYMLAVMVHMRGTEAEITFSAYTNATDPDTGERVPTNCRITDLNQAFTLEFTRGFLTPNGAMVKRDVKFTYNPDSKAWVKTVSSGGEASASAKINAVLYDGVTIEAGSQVELFETEKLDKKLFYLDLEDPSATWTINATELTAGLNDIVITVTASDGSATETFAFQVKVPEKAAAPAEKAGCGCGTVFAGGGPARLTGTLIVAGLALVALLFAGARLGRGRTER